MALRRPGSSRQQMSSGLWHQDTCLGPGLSSPWLCPRGTRVGTHHWVAYAGDLQSETHESAPSLGRLLLAPYPAWNAELVLTRAPHRRRGQPGHCWAMQWTHCPLYSFLLWLLPVHTHHWLPCPFPSVLALLLSCPSIHLLCLVTSRLLFRGRVNTCSQVPVHTSPFRIPC